jgi:YD repeat-containing protein
MAVSTATTRMYGPGETDASHSQVDYDAAGNQTKDLTASSGGGTRVYDAENRMTIARDASNNQIAAYTYDADGRRVKRNVTGQTEVWQAYGMGGELLAEYAANASPASPQKEYGYRNGQLLITATAATRSNFALSSNGAVASASTAQSGYPANSTNNGDRKGTNWGSGGGWADSDGGTFPDWLQVDFNGSKSIEEIDVFTVQDGYTNPVEPTESLTFSQYGLTGYDVQYWNGSAWTTVTGGSVSGNNKVWRKFTFAAITTSKIRVLTNAAVAGFSLLTEVEAWTSPTASSTSSTINWLVTDQLGTPRIVFDQSGSLAATKRHDYPCTLRTQMKEQQANPHQL